MSNVTISGDIIHPFVIEVENDCYVLYEVKTSKDGKTYRTALGYWSEFKNVMFEAAKRKAHHNLDGRTVDVKGYVNEFIKAQENIKKIVG